MAFSFTYYSELHIATTIIFYVNFYQVEMLMLYSV